ncbi:MAG: DUF1080 domain-containing protein [Planctomycetes bacterium]|nr:DUF1080 domain-containing protein [Planctomycetota bacterium]NBY01209.1 DUF1080 domain-containing protein [Planctomycetota bacterium]
MWLRLFCLFLFTPILLAQSDDAIELFNGKDLSGWVIEGPSEFDNKGNKEPIWVAENGMITCRVNNRKSYGFLRYDKKQFADFVFSLEYRLSEKELPKQSPCNSGIGIRTGAYDPKKSDSPPSRAGYEIQLLDDAMKNPDKHSTGSLYRYIAPSVKAVKPAPEWNKIEIECKGPRIKVTLNDQKIIDVDQTTVEEIKMKPLKGYVCVQNHGGKVDFRNLRVKELK